MSPKLEKQVRVWHLVLTFVGGIVAWIVIAAFAWSDVQHRLRSVEKSTEGLEDMKRDVAVTKNDVGWIRQQMEKD